MQPTASQAGASVAVAGLGAALVACAITMTILTSNPSPAAMTAPSAQPTNACQNIPLMLAVSTSTGGGTVRCREGSYLSPPITLSSVPQTVVFPRPRSTAAPIDEVITIDGHATDVVTTFPVSHLQRVYPRVTGILAISAHWQALKPC